ncbi:MAG: DNA translocase FtsK 4TM domain-containing protein, partial [Smithella sp.]|nr:DNA translocase FtsK 4TM domain-containing protein [Smithella sp.]
MLVKHYQEMLGAVLVSIALFSLIAIFWYVPADYAALLNNVPVQHVAGPVGGWTAYILRSLLGLSSYLFVVTLLVPGIFLLRNRWIDRVTEKIILLLLLTLGTSGLISLFIKEAPQLSGGQAGALIGGFVSGLLGGTTAYIILSGFVLVTAVVAVVMFLGPKHEHIEVTSGLMERFKSIAHRLPRGGESDGAKRSVARIPWIIKKRMVVYETEGAGDPLDSFGYPRLPEPEEEKEFLM